MLFSSLNLSRQEDGVRKRSTADHRGTVSPSFIDAVQNTPSSYSSSIHSSFLHSFIACTSTPPRFYCSFSQPLHEANLSFFFFCASFTILILHASLALIMRPSSAPPLPLLCIQLQPALQSSSWCMLRKTDVNLKARVPCILMELKRCQSMRDAFSLSCEEASADRLRMRW